MKLRQLKEKIEVEIQRLRQELLTLRTGRATSALIEDLKVAAYEGSAPLSLKELGAISIPDAVTIVVKPWDLSLLPKIEKALRASTGGFNPVAFDDLLRINLPPPSQERRLEMVKVVKSRSEAAKVELRQIRQDEMRSVDEMEKNGVISQDERFKTRDEVEKIIKAKTEEIERIIKEKETELLKL